MTTEEYPHVPPWSAWSEEQLAHVRYLATRLAKAEDAVDRVRDLIAFYDRHGFARLAVDDLRHALNPEKKP
jgi:hypothetical protein